MAPQGRMWGAVRSGWIILFLYETTGKARGGGLLRDEGALEQLAMLPVVILAGGLGTRLLPVSAAIPKALIEIRGEPFLAHQLRLLHANGIGRVVLCVGHLGEQIQEFAGDGSRFGIRLLYSFDGPQLRGTAGAIRNALHLLGQSFFVLYGDSYLPCDYAAVESAFQESGKNALMTICRNENRWDRSNVQFTDGRILRYDKKNWDDAMEYIDYGLGIFRSKVFEALPETGAHDLASVYGTLALKGELAAFVVRERFYEIGSFSGIAALSEHLSGGQDR